MTKFLRTSYFGCENRKKVHKVEWINWNVRICHIKPYEDLMHRLIFAISPSIYIYKSLHNRNQTNNRKKSIDCFLATCEMILPKHITHFFSVSFFLFVFFFVKRSKKSGESTKNSDSRIEWKIWSLQSMKVEILYHYAIDRTLALTRTRSFIHFCLFVSLSTF